MLAPVASVKKKDISIAQVLEKLDEIRNALVVVAKNSRNAMANNW